MAYTYPFELPPLPYGYDALEPHIDTETMHYHHDKHFKTYIENLNNILKKYPALQPMTLTQLLTAPPGQLPQEDWTGIHNNAGGVYNHALFFEGLSPAGSGGHLPQGGLASAIYNTFGSYENFKKAFTATALGVFGSGWACLALTKGGELRILSLKNQETALIYNAQSLVLFDVWEHAYYLKYRNLRAEFVDNLWKVVTFPVID